MQQPKNPEAIARRAIEDAERAKKDALWRELEAPLHEELANAGVVVKSYRYVIDRPPNFRLAIPILVRHMQLDKYPDLMRNFMAQAIAMKEANPYWHDFVRLYKQAVPADPKAIFAQGLAVAISKSWKGPELDELVELCLNPEYGDSRILIASGLRRSKDDRAKATLLALKDDPKLGPQVRKWLKKKTA